MSTVETQAEPEVAKPVAVCFPEHRITTERYLKMVEAGVFADGEPIFLLDGKLVEEMTKGTPHNSASDKLIYLLVALVPQGWYVRVEKPILMADGSVPEPDLMIVRGGLEDYTSRMTVPADVVISIEIADSSLPQDFRVKLPLYAKAGIPVYWLVNIPSRRLEVYEGPTASGYARRHDFGLDDEVPVILDGREVGRLAASGFLPLA